MRSMKYPLQQPLPLQSIFSKNITWFRTYIQVRYPKLKHIVRTAKPISNLFNPFNQPLYTNLKLLHKFIKPPKRKDISTEWQKFHGFTNYENLLDPFHPNFRKEIIKYGEFAQATYDALDFDPDSKFCGSCRYNPKKFFDRVGLCDSGYDVTKYIYAMCHVNIPHWLARSHLHVLKKWSKDSNWMGFVGVSDEHESRRIGRRDIVVSWRGTKTPAEMFKNLQRKMEPFGEEGEVKVEHGFLNIYQSKCKSTRYNKSSASEQVMEEVQRLVNFYREKGEEVSLTITGHSLGAALASLNAYEIASTIPDLPINVLSFASPRVGNLAFRERSDKMKIKTLRLVVNEDYVPTLPLTMMNYEHVGTELRLCGKSSPYLKQGFHPGGYHRLETYLHLLDAYVSPKMPFRPNATRAVALVNKTCDILKDEYAVAKSWYEHKVYMRSREDIPPYQIEEEMPNSSLT